MNRTITYKEMLRFYLPLVINIQIMSLAMPVVNMGLGRVSNPEFAIAAFSIGMAFVSLLSSPSIIARNASTALITDRASFLFVRRIFVMIGAAISCLTLLIALTPLHNLIFLNLFEIPESLIDEVRRVLIIVSPMGVTIAVREVHQGVALIHRKSGVLVYTTLIRLSTISVVVFVAAIYLKLPGTTGGSLGIMIGMGMEMLFAYLQTRHLFDQSPDAPPPTRKPLTFAEVFHFTYPLAVGMYVMTFLPMLINSILSRTAHPELALAGFGVIFPILDFMTSPQYSFQTVTLVFYQSQATLKKLTWMIVAISLACSGLLVGIGYFSAGRWLVTNIFHLKNDLAVYTYPGMLLMFLVPLGMGARCHIQGMLMRLRQTKMMSVSAITKTLAMFGVGMLFVRAYPAINGVALGVALMAFCEFWDDLIIGSAAFTYLRKSPKAL